MLPTPVQPTSRTWPCAPLAMLAAALSFALSVAHAQEAPAPSTPLRPGPVWPDTFVARVEALALVQSLNAEILASRSATLSLEKWCGEHRLAAAPTIVARVMRGVEKPPSPEQRQRLQIAGDQEVRYRRVQLQCGTHVLSEAENWYVPARLTAEMNRLLETTETPFGRVVQQLEPYRQTLAAALLWRPLPEGWAHDSSITPPASAGALAIPAALFEHRALLYTREHTPFAEVIEVYQRGILAFPPPRGY